MLRQFSAKQLNKKIKNHTQRNLMAAQRDTMCIHVSSTHKRLKLKRTIVFDHLYEQQTATAMLVKIISTMHFQGGMYKHRFHDDNRCSSYARWHLPAKLSQLSLWPLFASGFIYGAQLVFRVRRLHRARWSTHLWKQDGLLHAEIRPMSKQKIPIMFVVPPFAKLLPDDNVLMKCFRIWVGLSDTKKERHGKPMMDLNLKKTKVQVVSFDTLYN